MLRDFKQFLLRGNVVDLAVGVVIGAAFNSLVMALVRDFITPLVGAVAGKQRHQMTISVGPASLLVGDFLDALISFLLVAAVVFFLIVKPVNLLVSRSRHSPTPDPATRKCPECLSEIALEARRCPYCTSQVEPEQA